MFPQTTRILALVTLSVAGLLSATNPASAKPRRRAAPPIGAGRVVRLAAELERQARQFHRAVDNVGLGGPLLHRDAVALQRLARHIHDVARRGGSPRHLRFDLRELMGIVRNAEVLLDGLVRSGRMNYFTARGLTGELRDVRAVVLGLQYAV